MSAIAARVLPQVCCGGVLQGRGRQRRGMPVVLLSYYGVALPAGCALGFSAGWGARGERTMSS